MPTPEEQQTEALVSATQVAPKAVAVPPASPAIETQTLAKNAVVVPTPPTPDAPTSATNAQTASVVSPVANQAATSAPLALTPTPTRTPIASTTPSNEIEGPKDDSNSPPRTFGRRSLLSSAWAASAIETPPVSPAATLSTPGNQPPPKAEATETKVPEVVVAESSAASQPAEPQKAAAPATTTAKQATPSVQSSTVSTAGTSSIDRSSDQTPEEQSEASQPESHQTVAVPSAAVEVPIESSSAEASPPQNQAVVADSRATQQPRVTQPRVTQPRVTQPVSESVQPDESPDQPVVHSAAPGPARSIRRILSSGSLFIERAASVDRVIVDITADATNLEPVVTNSNSSSIRRLIASVATPQVSHLDSDDSDQEAADSVFDSLGKSIA